MQVEQDRWVVTHVNQEAMPQPRFAEWPLFDVHGSTVASERSQQMAYEISPSLGEVPLVAS